MIDFWLVSLVLVVFALGFVIYPLFRTRQKRVALDRRAQNIAVFKDRLAEIAAEKQTGVISDEQYQQLKTELEAGLITDVEGLDDEGPVQQQRTVKKSSPLVWVVTGVLMLGIPLVSYGLYSKWGALDGVAQYREWGNSVPAVSNGMPKQNIEELLTALRDKLEANPDNADGWFMLARSSMNLEQYDQASYAFMRMAALLEKQQQDPSAIYGLAAQALFFAEQGQMTAQVKEVLDSAFAINPDETNGLGLLGIAAFEDRRYEDAIKYWSRILDVEPDNPSRDAIIAGIEKAKAALGLTSQFKVPAANQLPQNSNASAVAEDKINSDENAADVKVLVELDPSLQGMASPNDTLFIFAKALSGPPLPLAVSRKTVADLPILVNLNDEMAMGPMAKISSVSEVSVVARITKGGQPTAKAGDFEGAVSPVVVGSNEVVRILINKQIN